MRNQLAAKLPNEIMLEIFCRLDIQSLFRVKFVCCKAWQDMIDDDPRFDCMHLAATAKSPGFPLLILDPIYYSEPYLTIMHALKEDGDSFKTSLVAEVVMDSDLMFGGSCNGLLCFFTKYDVFICNPLLKEVVTILRSTIGTSASSGLGFGFDSKSNTYKIVHVIYVENERINVNGVEVHTLGTNSWRKVNEKPKYSMHYFRPVFAHGALHWNTNDRYDGILSFDLDKEEFYVTPCPDCRRYRLVELDGLLAMVCSYELRSCLQIWLCDGTKKWRQKYILDRQKVQKMDSKITLIEVMGMLKSGEIVLKTYKFFCAYNPKNDYCRRISNDLITDKTKFIDFRGSLVSPYKFMPKSFLNFGISEIHPRT